MMSNADWRETQRTKNVKHYREMEEKQVSILAFSLCFYGLITRMISGQLQEKDERADKDPDFIRKQLERAAASGSVEKRIQANRHNIQRGAFSMDSNFARR